MTLLAEDLATLEQYPKPRAIISRGELLTEPARKLMEGVFGCPVANLYNSEEVGNMAWECRDRPGILHVNTDACILELLDDDDASVPDGVEGRVVLTNLYNLTMPFIRYDIGDRATWQRQRRYPCSCGAFTPTLCSVEGRSDDYILLPDAHRVSPRVIQQAVSRGTTSITPSGDRIRHALQFQVVQEEMGTAEIRMVPRGDLPDGLEESVATEFRKLHPQFRTRLVIVEDVQLAASGKAKRIVRRRTGNASEGP